MSLQNLEICGLTTHLLWEFKKVASVGRDRVEFSADGSYILLAERAHGKKRSCIHDKVNARATSQKTSDEHEAINIL